MTYLLYTTSRNSFLIRDSLFLSLLTMNNLEKHPVLSGKRPFHGGVLETPRDMLTPAISMVSVVVGNVEMAMTQRP